MMKKKDSPKPADLFEVECIKNSDTFVAHNCEDGTSKELLDYEEAVRIVLCKEGRVLVYGYNRDQEENKGGSRRVLLTERNIKLYEAR